MRVTAHEAKAVRSSQPGVGTTFKVRLFLPEVHAQADDAHGLGDAGLEAAGGDAGVLLRRHVQQIVANIGLDGVDGGVAQQHKGGDRDQT